VWFIGDKDFYLMFAVVIFWVPFASWNDGRAGLLLMIMFVEKPCFDVVLNSGLATGDSLVYFKVFVFSS
jgi:hypothetical protein